MLREWLEIAGLVVVFLFIIFGLWAGLYIVDAMQHVQQVLP